MIFLKVGLLLVWVASTLALALITVGLVYAPQPPRAAGWRGWGIALLPFALLLSGIGWLGGTIFFWMVAPVLLRYARKDRLTIIAFTLAPVSWLWPMLFKSDIVWSMTQHPIMVPVTLVAAITCLLVPTRARRGRPDSPPSPPRPRRPVSA